MGFSFLWLVSQPVSMLCKVQRKFFCLTPLAGKAEDVSSLFCIIRGKPAAVQLLNCSYT